MSNYLRNYQPGGMFFLTIVTHQRQRILTTNLGRKLLKQGIQQTQQEWPFEVFAIVLLPDHFHAVMKLPPSETKYSQRIKRIKELFTRDWLANGGTEGKLTEAQINRGERGIWQRRFWEHTIRDSADLKRCVDYVHFNPVKHNLVQQVSDWKWSSFQRFVVAGEYQPNWGKNISQKHNWRDFLEYDR